MTEKVTVALNKENPEPPEVIADAIIRISAGFDKLTRSGLTLKTIALLVKDATGARGVPMHQTLRVLQVLPRLAELYVLPEKRKKAVKPAARARRDEE